MRRSNLINFFIIVIVAFCSVTGFAGDLNPVAPPAAGGTMKSLDELEPRTPIPATTTPAGTFTISQSGSYYLAGNRACSGTGITVNADNVTIDLCGFTLSGPDMGTNYGIYMNGRDNVEIRNGTVRDFRTGIYEMSTNGKNHHILNIRAMSNLINGIYLLGNQHLVRDCLVTDNADTTSGYNYMIYVGNGSTVSGNTVCNNGKQSSGSLYCIRAGFGCIVSSNSVYKNGLEKTSNHMYGIQVNTGSTLSHNTVYLNGESVEDTIFYAIYAGHGCTVTTNTAVSNGLSAVDSTVYGFYVANNCAVDCNTAYDNPTDYVHVSCSKGVNAGL